LQLESTQEVDYEEEAKLEAMELLGSQAEPIVLTDSEEDEPVKKKKKASHREGSDPQSTDWCFTINNPEKKSIKALKQLRINPDVQYLVFQGEKGANGTPHIQGFLQLKKKKRMRIVKEMLGGNAHLEFRRGTVKQAMDYPKKDKSYCPEVHERVEHGEANMRDKQGKRSDLDDIAQKIMDGADADTIMTEHPKHYILHRSNIRSTIADVQSKVERKGHKLIILYGDAGTGKSYTARQLLDKAAGGEGLHTEVANDLSDYGQKNCPRYTLMEEFKGNIPLSCFKSIFDSGSTHPPLHQRYINVTYLSEFTIITSNYHPACWYDMSDTDLCAMYRRIDECWHFEGVYDDDDANALTITKHIVNQKNTKFSDLPEWFVSGRKAK